MIIDILYEECWILIYCCNVEYLALRDHSSIFNSAVYTVIFSLRYNTKCKYENDVLKMFSKIISQYWWQILFKSEEETEIK